MPRVSVGEGQTININIDYIVKPITLVDSPCSTRPGVCPYVGEVNVIVGSRIIVSVFHIYLIAWTHDFYGYLFTDITSRIDGISGLISKIYYHSATLEGIISSYK